MRKLAVEQRKKSRLPLSVHVKYNEVAGTLKDEKQLGEGETFDVNSGGVGIFSKKELAAGTMLEIECPDIWETPKKFTVRWCQTIKFGFYRVGLALKE